MKNMNTLGKIILIFLLILMFFWPIMKYLETKILEKKISKAVIHFGKLNCNTDIQNVKIKFTQHGFSETISWHAETQPIISNIDGIMPDFGPSKGLIILYQYGTCLNIKDNHLYLNHKNLFEAFSTAQEDIPKNAAHHSTIFNLGDIFVTFVLFFLGAFGIFIMYLARKYFKKTV